MCILSICLFSYVSPPDFPDPVVTISDPTIGTAGEEFQLTCIVSVIQYLITEPTIQ